MPARIGNNTNNTHAGGTLMDQIGNDFGVNSYAYTQSMTAADCLCHLADRGVRAFELMFFPGHLWTTDGATTRAEIRRVISTHDLELVSLNSPNIDLNIAAASDEMRALSLKTNLAYLQMAGELGAGGLILGPGKPNPLLPLPREVLSGHFYRALDQLVPRAERCGVQLYVENMPFAFLPAATDVMEALAEFGDDGIKVCYDLANAHFIGENPVAGLQAVAPRLALIHVSDTTRSVYRHDAVGAGDVDFRPIPTAIADAGHDRPVMLEIISPDPDRDIAGSAAALRAIGLVPPY